MQVSLYLFNGKPYNHGKKKAHGKSKYKNPEHRKLKMRNTMKANRYQTDNKKL
jgi:hypothetical protein